jgi:hypothetical protein
MGNSSLPPGTQKLFEGDLFCALATLIFSLGFPFSIKGFEWMINYLGPFKQFRGLGRFTWAFYYVVNVLAFYILWNKSQRIQISDKWISALKIAISLVGQKPSKHAQVEPDMDTPGRIVLGGVLLSAEQCDEFGAQFCATKSRSFRAGSLAETRLISRVFRR